MDMSDEFRIQLGLRIAEIVARFPTKTEAAEVAGVTLETLRKWVAGSVRVPIEGLRRLARGNDDDFSWLCIGARDASKVIRGPSGRVFHEAVLRNVLAALADVVANKGVTFHPDRFADLAFDLHDYAIKKQIEEGASADLEGIAHFITVAARSQR
jgi:predicted site-specific integrase-resolvase